MLGHPTREDSLELMLVGVEAGILFAGWRAGAAALVCSIVVMALPRPGWPLGVIHGVGAGRLVLSTATAAWHLCVVILLRSAWVRAAEIAGNMADLAEGWQLQREALSQQIETPCAEASAATDP